MKAAAGAGPGGGGAAAPSGAAFWRFSLSFYARPGMAEALIRLQDRGGRDVNLMLFAMWSAAFCCRRLGTADLAAAAAAAAPMHGAIVEPLRRMRRRMKPDPDAQIQQLRRRLVLLELAAERQVQHRLAASLMPAGLSVAPGDRLATAAANLGLYLGAELDGSAEAAVLREELSRFILRR